jgi:O-antigen/teichoic acid export membrane protein
VSLKRNLLYNFVLSFSQVVFPLISIPYVSRVLDPTGIGKVSFIDSITYYFIVIAEFGIVTYGIREVSRKKSRTKELEVVVSELLSLHLLTSCISILLYIVALLFLYPKVGDFKLILFSVAFLLVNSFACEWYFWGTEQFKYITIRSLITRTLGLISIFVLIQQPKDYVWYYAIIAGSAIVGLIWNGFTLFKKIDIKIRRPRLRKYWPALKITYQISLVYSVVLMLDNVFLQLLSTSAAVAYYAYSAKIVRIAAALVTDSLLVFYPRTVSLVHSNNKSDVQKVILNTSHFIILATIPMAAGIFLLSEKLTKIYFGEQFLPLVTNLKILAIYPFVKAYSLFLNKQLLMPYDKEKIVLNGLWVGAAVFIASTIPLSFYYQDKGACVAVIISELSVLLYYLSYLRLYRYDLKFVKKRVLFQAITGSALFFPLVYVLNGIIKSPVLNLIVLSASCVLFYFIFLFFITKNQMIISLIHSVKATITVSETKTKNT